MCIPAMAGNDAAAFNVASLHGVAGDGFAWMDPRSEYIKLLSMALYMALACIRVFSRFLALVFAHDRLYLFIRFRLPWRL